MCWFYGHLYSMNWYTSYPITKQHCTWNPHEVFLNGTLSHSLTNTNANLSLKVTPKLNIFFPNWLFSYKRHLEHPKGRGHPFTSYVPWGCWVVGLCLGMGLLTLPTIIIFSCREHVQFNHVPTGRFYNILI